MILPILDLEMNRKLFRDHPIIIELKKINVPDSEKINLIYSIEDLDLLSYIAIYLKDQVLRRTAFLRISDEQMLKQTIDKISQIERNQEIDESFFDK